MIRLAFIGLIFLVTLCTAEENTFITKGDQYATLGENENVIKIKNPFFLFADREGRSKGLWGRSRNDVETNEIEKDRRPLLVFRPYYSLPNSQYSLQPPHPDAKPIFEIRKKRNVDEIQPETGDGILARVKRTHHKCRKCGGYGGAPAYVQPVVAQPVYTQPVVAQPVYTQPAYIKPVIAQPVYTQPSHGGGCHTCGQGGLGGGGGGGGSYSYSQSSASSSSGSFGYGKK